jgi:protein TonB
MQLTRERVARKEPLLDLSAVRAGRVGASRVRLFVPSSGWGGRHRREMLLGAGMVAVLFHLAMVAAVVEVPRLMPAFMRAPPPQPPPPPPEAELEMVKQDTPTVGGSPPPRKGPPPAPQVKPEQAQAGGGSAPSLDAPQGPPIPPPDDHPADQAGKPDAGHDAKATPPPAPPNSPMQVNLDLDGQPGWGLVDQRTLPASPDDQYVNKPAAYPRMAALRGEEGTVYLSTLIAPDGRVESVQIIQSSGHPDLDRAARNAISAWHFRPAVQGGQPVQSEMREAYRFSITQ